MNRRLLKTRVEAVTGRSDVIAWTAETLGISHSSAAMKLRGDSPLLLTQALQMRDALHLTAAQFTAIFLASEENKND